MPSEELEKYYPPNYKIFNQNIILNNSNSRNLIKLKNLIIKKLKMNTLERT